jgi:hypothetical protein
LSTFEKATTPAAIIYTATTSVGTGVPLTYDTSAINGTLSHSATPTAATTSGGLSSEAGVVTLGRNVVLMVAGVVGIALL